MTGADQAVGAPERLHPLYLVTGLGKSFKSSWGLIAAGAVLIAKGYWWTLAALAIGVPLVSFISLYFTWRRFEYRVGANEIRIDSGILNRTHRSIPFDRIQDVDISQGPIARLLGLARVEFETGGSAGDKNDDSALAAIALDRAAALRDQVRARRATALDPGPDLAASEQAEAAPIFAMDARRVLIAGVFNFSLAVLAGLFGATQTLGDVAGFDFFARRFWREALDAGSPIADLILAHRIAAVVAGSLLLVAIGLAAGVGRTVLREYRFRLDRTATGLRRRRGLLTLTDVTLPITRVQAAIVATGPLRERFGWHILKLQSLAKDKGNKGDHVVAPLASQAEVSTILAQLGWRGVDPGVEWHRVSAAYAWQFTLLVALLLVPAAIQVWFMPLIGGAAVAIVAALIATRWLGWQRYRYALDGDRLLVRSGWWGRRLLILPLANIQSVDLTEDILSRSFGVASLAIGVASGRGFSNHAIVALPSATARALREKLLAPFA